jgi:hypothetical protein
VKVVLKSLCSAVASPSILVILEALKENWAKESV